MSYYPHDGSWAVEPMPMAPHDRVRFADDRAWWTVAAVTEDHVALTRQAPFHARGTVVYTVIDWRHGVRGPCNTLGRGYDIDGTDPGPDCTKMLADFTPQAWDRGREPLSISQRAWVRLDLVEHTPAQEAVVHG